MPRRNVTFLIIAVLWVAPARAQLVEPNQVGVRMGHVHLAVKDVDAQKQFWISVMGGRLVTNGPLELIQSPGVFIMLSKAESPAPPTGSIVEHFGFIVKDMPAALAKWKAAGIKHRVTKLSPRPAGPEELAALFEDAMVVW